MRLVALLFALADLAESAALRSPAVRGFVLWILRRAELVARDLVSGAPAPQASCSLGTSSAEARRLAEDFRELARELDCQIALAFAVHDDPVQNEEARFGAGVLNIMNALAFPAPDILRSSEFPDTS